MIDEAKAVQEVAKSVGKAIDAASEVGSFLRELCGESLQDAVGLVHDRLRYYRAVNLLQLQEKYKQALEKRGVERTQAIPLQIALPVFEAAAIEEDQDLRELWANLLASAADPRFDGPVRRSLIDIAKQLEPSEAIAFAWAYHELRDRQGKSSVNVTEIVEYARLDPSESGPILDNLTRVNLLMYSPVSQTGRNAFAFGRDTGAVRLTELGCAFGRACMP